MAALTDLHQSILDLVPDAGGQITLTALRDAGSYDFMTNAALIHPDRGQCLAEAIDALPQVETLELTATGFINIRVASAFWDSILNEDASGDVRISLSEDEVFSLQYAHTLCCAVATHASTLFSTLPQGDAAFLTSLAERALLRHLAVAARGTAQTPMYFMELVRLYQNWWEAGPVGAQLRFLVPNAPDATAARLSLNNAVQKHLARGLAMAGVLALNELTTTQQGKAA